MLFIQGSIYALGSREGIPVKRENPPEGSFELAVGVITDMAAVEQIDTENQFTVFLKPYKQACLYLILFSSDKEVVWFYPPEQNFFSAAYYNQEYFLPNREFWDKKREPGVYSLFLIVSREPMPELEKLLWSPATDTSEAEMYVRNHYTGFLLKSNNDELPLTITGSIRNNQAADGELLIDIIEASPLASLEQELRKNKTLFTGIALYIKKFEIVFK